MKTITALLTGLILLSAAPVAAQAPKSTVMATQYRVLCIGANQSQGPAYTQMRIDACTQLAQDLGESRSTRAAAYNNRGKAYGESGRFTQAIDDFNAAMRLVPNDALALINRGHVYALQKDFPKAFADLDKAVMLYGSPAAFANRGLAWLLSGDERKALTDLDVAAKAPATLPEVHVWRCGALAILGERLKEAADDCDIVLKASPDQPEALVYRALIELRAGQNQAAYDDFSAAFRLQPTRTTALYGRGIAQIRLGRTEPGQADVRDALAKDAQVAAMFQRIGLAP